MPLVTCVRSDCSGVGFDIVVRLGIVCSVSPLAIAVWQSVGSTPAAPTQSWKHGENAKMTAWQLPLDNIVLTPDNGSVSRVSRLFLMPTDLILSDRPRNTQIGPLAEIADRASEFIRQSKSKNTVRARSE